MKIKDYSELKVSLEGNRLTVENNSINISGLDDLLKVNGLEGFSQAIEGIILGIAQLGAFLINKEDFTERDLEDIRICFPCSDDLFYLKILADSLRTMQCDKSTDADKRLPNGPSTHQMN